MSMSRTKNPTRVRIQTVSRVGNGSLASKVIYMTKSEDLVSDVALKRRTGWDRGGLPVPRLSGFH